MGVPVNGSHLMSNRYVLGINVALNVNIFAPEPTVSEFSRSDIGCTNPFKNCICQPKSDHSKSQDEARYIALHGDPFKNSLFVSCLKGDRQIFLLPIKNKAGAKHGV